MMEMMNGFLGDRVLVNGQPQPTSEVDAAWHRVRLLNASNLDAVAETSQLADHLAVVSRGLRSNCGIDSDRRTRHHTLRASIVAGGSRKHPTGAPRRNRACI